MISLKEIEEFAIKSHADVNHKYGDKPYEVHLRMVVTWGQKFLYLIPTEDREAFIAGLWLHDTIEDCRLTYGDILRKTKSELVADIVYAVSNEKGKTRSERANGKYYYGIRKQKYAKPTKLSDRLGNVQNSLMEMLNGISDRMFLVYKSENANFIYKLVKPEWYELGEHFKALLLGRKKYLEYRIGESIYTPMINELINMFDEQHYNLIKFSTQP